jgi:hypothetical protein
MYNAIVCAIAAVMLASTAVVAKPRNSDTNGQTREQFSAARIASVHPFGCAARRFRARRRGSGAVLGRRRFIRSDMQPVGRSSIKGRHVA